MARAAKPSATAPISCLFAQTQFRYNSAVPLNIHLGKVIQKIPSLAYHLQQAPAGVMVLLVGAQMLGQVVDPLGQYGDLYLGRTGVSLVTGILLNNLGLFSFCHNFYTFPAALSPRKFAQTFCILR